VNRDMLLVSGPSVIFSRVSCVAFKERSSLHDSVRAVQ
jgi:hypothetical protein